MRVRVKYFALLREALGLDEETVDLADETATVGSLKALLADKDDAHRAAFSSVKRIRAAVNGTMAAEGASLKDQDEVAYFPPVTGG